MLTLAQLKQAKVVYERYRELQIDASVSRQEYEKAEADYQVQQAAVGSLDAQIRSAQVGGLTRPGSTWAIPASTRRSQATWWASLLRKWADGDRQPAGPGAAQAGQPGHHDRQGVVCLVEADVIHITPGQAVYFTILGKTNATYAKLRHRACPTALRPEQRQGRGRGPASQLARCSTTPCSRCPTRTTACAGRRHDWVKIPCSIPRKRFDRAGGGTGWARRRLLRRVGARRQ